MIVLALALEDFIRDFELQKPLYSTFADEPLVSSA
jgi:hypothetical protein